jgi:hypothetical protein
MSMSTRGILGFDRTIHLEWLDVAAARIARGEERSEIRKVIWSFLEDLVPGNTNSSGRGKTLTVLTRIWLTVPDHVQPLREDALKCFATASGKERAAVHWAMVIATHPFFFDVATNVGNFLTLHGQANRSQIKRRMTEAWGDRSTLERTIQQVLRSMVQWELLRPGLEKGSLIAPTRVVEVADDLAEILVYSIILGHSRGMLLSQLRSHPALFPFKVNLSSERIRRNRRLRVQREGDQGDFVEPA